IALAVSLLAARQGLAWSKDDGPPTPSLRESARDAKAVLIGSFANPRSKDGGFTGETDFLIESVIRNHATIKGKTKLVFREYVELAEKKKLRCLLFCNVTGEAVGPSRVTVLQGPRTAEYCKKALALDPKAPVANLAFFFQHLNDADLDIAYDAYREF